MCGGLHFGPCALILWVCMRSWPSILGVSFDFLCPSFKNSVNLGWSIKDGMCSMFSKILRIMFENVTEKNKFKKNNKFE